MIEYSSGIWRSQVLGADIGGSISAIVQKDGWEAILSYNWENGNLEQPGIHFDGFGNESVYNRDGSANFRNSTKALEELKLESICGVNFQSVLRASEQFN